MQPAIHINNRLHNDNSGVWGVGWMMLVLLSQDLESIDEVRVNVHSNLEWFSV